MRTLPYSLLSQLRRARIRYPLLPQIHRRRLHASPPVFSQTLEPPPSSSSSHAPTQILPPIADGDPGPGPAPESESDAAMNEFLSRFVHAIRPILAQAFPDLSKQVIDSMLLLICQRVVAEIDGSSQETPAVDLSDDLWKTINEVSKSVNEAMRRDRMRAELKKYLHHEDVKEMCRFAGDVGIRGDMLREFRFKWAREKLEEVEFYRDLERIRENAMEEEEGAKIVKVESLPKRKGKIQYKIYGLDLSDEKWAEVAEKVEAAEAKFVKVEPKPVVGRSKRLEDKFFSLDFEKEDFMPVLKEWAEALEAKRVDWLALLERIKAKNSDLYFKVAELLLTEDSFEPNIRDYSKLIDAHSKADRLEDAERILTKMTEKGIEPDVLTSIILVHMYSKSGNLERAEEAFKSLKAQGFKPDLKVFASMITAYVNAGLPRMAEKLTSEMEIMDMKPTREMYMEVLRAYAEQGLVSDAQRVVNMMQFAGIQQSLESYTLLIEAYAHAGDPDQARWHFDNMKQSGLTADDRCTASVMTAYAKKNYLDKALGLLLCLKKEGFKPGVATNSVLVDWLGMLQLVDEAEQVVEEIKAAGDDLPFDIHVGLCDMYARAGNEEKAKMSLRILEGRKERLRAEQFERVIGGLVAGGLMDEAKRVCDVMQEMGFSLSEPVRVALLSAQSFPRLRPQQPGAPQRPGPRRW